MSKRILLMYISEYSGHHQASVALEKAILAKNPAYSARNINAFRYTNPVMEKITHTTYMRLIKKRPEIWDYLYDNPAIVKKTARIRKLANHAGLRKIHTLISDFKPDVVACTQAFPCGIVANYKRVHRNNIPLVGILTDYAPHSYWIHEQVDAYVVPSEEIKRAFMQKGVSEEKIKVLGTPIDPIFDFPVNKEEISAKLGLSPEKPTMLVMGGSLGMGSNEKLITLLDDSEKDFQIIAVTGINKRLSKKLNSMKITLRKNAVILGFAKNIHELMGVADIIISKPGGLTAAEALTKSLPMIILNPLPGQESLNARILAEKGIAIKARDENDAVEIAESLLSDPLRLQKMREAARFHARPRSASEIAEFLLALIK